MDEEQKLNNKKKKTHYFEIYINKVLKQISETSGITLDSKQQINSLLCILSKIITDKSIKMCILASKKTISDKEIKHVLKFILSGELLINSISEGEKAVNNFKENKNNKNLKTKSSKSNILFPPSLCEKFLRQFGYNKILISTTAPIFLAAVLEYITFEILDMSNSSCKERKKIRITIKDIELSVRSDTEFNLLFTQLNISFLGGGVLPFIHNSLLNNKIAKKPLKKINNRRYHSGTIAIRNIKKQQKFSDTLVFGKKSFEYFVRQIFKENNCNSKISKDIFTILQYFIEQYIVNILKNANFLAIHAGRVKVIPSDIGLISFFNNKSKNPYQDNEEINIDLFSIENDYENSENLNI